MAPSAPPARQPVPVRAIAAAIGMVLATVVALVVLQALARIVAVVVIAAFFAVILNPAVDFLEHRLRFRRALACLVVFLVGTVLVAAMLYAFIQPIVDQTQSFVESFPEFMEEARAGEGPVGGLVERFNLAEYLQRNQNRLREGLNNAGAPALEVARTIFSTVAALLTILVLAFLMLLQGPKLTRGIVDALPEARGRRLSRVAADCARALTGYMAGNLMISLIAGLATYVALWVAGVPFKSVLALWVAFADLIPLVGATLGAIPAVGVAFIHSTAAGVGVLLFYIAYQQFENHVLQVTIMSRTVDLSPLLVLVAVLCGVELFGILGALLAIPAAGVIQVIVRDLYDERKGRLKPEPTVGTDEIPITDS